MVDVVVSHLWYEQRAKKVQEAMVPMSLSMSMSMMSSSSVGRGRHGNPAMYVCPVPARR